MSRNLTNTTIENPQTGNTFVLGGQQWVIENVNTYANEALKFYMNKMGINATLTIRKPNGKKLFSVMHMTDNKVWEVEIINA